MRNMDGNNETDKIDDVMLPGFRFHPTDEELVGFYLKRKIQQRPLPIELIKQVDIYNYDPWDLPNLAPTGEKEWYFYCPRDRKYRNSARPNRVTRAGFWKATGTDRPIYSCDGSKCIGLKKSLVFYKGRAAKGLKTDWMMHEFRLPSILDSGTAKKFLDKNFSPRNSWAICRIFKKANSMAQRALSHSWVSLLPEITASDTFLQSSHYTQFSSENMSCTTETGSVIQLCNNLQQNFTTSISAHDIPSNRPINPTFYKTSSLGVPNGDLHNGLVFSPLDFSGPSAKSTVDISTMHFNLSPALTGDANKTTDCINPQQEFNNFSMSSPDEMQGSIGTEEIDAGLTKNCSATHDNNLWGNIQPIGFPFSLTSSLPDAWKPNLAWDSFPCPSEVSPTYSISKCYS